MLAGAVVPNRSGLLAVACQPSGRERVQRCIFRSTSEHALAESGASVDGLEGTDVEVFAGVRARHESQLGRRQVERVDAAGFDKSQKAERLDRGAQRHRPLRVAEDTDNRTRRVDLDDVAAVLALDDLPADLPNEYGRRRPAAGLPSAGAGSERPGAVSGSCGEGCGQGEISRFKGVVWKARSSARIPLDVAERVGNRSSSAGRNTRVFAGTDRGSRRRPGHWATARTSPVVQPDASGQQGKRQSGNRVIFAVLASSGEDAQELR